MLQILFQNRPDAVSVYLADTHNRYYNTTERMTGLFGKITDQMIVNCKDCITGKDTMDALWEKVRA